jgi:hypothetical protein
MERTTRRAAFGAIGSIAAAGLIAGHAARAAVSSQIEKLWAEYRAIRRESETLDIDDDDASVSLWNRLSRVEQAIIDCDDAGTRAAEIKLWIALDHSGGWGHSLTRASETLIPDEDTVGLRAMFVGLDFDAKAVAAAILALRGEA